MKETTESMQWLCFLAIYGILFAVDYILGSVFHLRYKDLAYHLTFVCIMIAASFGYLLYLWRTDLPGFLKRIFIAVPFALLYAAFVIIITKALVGSVFALTVYFFLLYKTPSWKQHFSITLACAFTLSLALKFSSEIITSPDKYGVSFYWEVIPIAIIIFIVYFYGSYLRKVQNGGTICLRPIFIRIFKFTCAFCIYFATWLALQRFCKYHQVSLPVNLVVSSVLTIAFLVICYLFDLMLIERKKKKSKLGELQNQLNNFYLKENEKSIGG